MSGRTRGSSRDPPAHLHHHPLRHRSAPRSRDRLAVLRCPVVEALREVRGHQARLAALPGQRSTAASTDIKSPRRPLQGGQADAPAGEAAPREAASQDAAADPDSDDGADADRDADADHGPDGNPDGDSDSDSHGDPDGGSDATPDDDPDGDSSRSPDGDSQCRRPTLIYRADVTLLRQRIAAGARSPTRAPGSSSATARSRPPRRRRPLSTSARPTRSAYTLLDTDSRHARNLAVAYAATGSTGYAAKAQGLRGGLGDEQPSRLLRLHRRLPGRLPPVLRRVLVRLRLRPHAGRRRLLDRANGDGPGVVPHLGLRHEGLSGQLRQGLLVHAYGPPRVRLARIEPDL